MLTRDQVNALNPWWADPAWRPADDLHLAAAGAAPFRWDPRPFDPEDLASGAVFGVPEVPGFFRIGPATGG